MFFPSRDDVIVWIIKNQFGRRNLPAYERARLALRLKPVIAEKAKENQRGGQGGILLSQKSVEAKPVDTQKEIAKAAGVSHDTIAKVEKIEAHATPEMKEQLRTGQMSINQAYQTVRREEKKQEVQQRIEEHAAAQTGVIDIQQTDRKYNIIYADPPWRYWESGNKNQALHYTTMTIDEICDLPVKNIADDNCVLFLWVTYPILHEAFRVIESWGFKYSTAAFVWVKKNKQKDSPFVGCGAWTRANSELCLLATKGNIMRLDASISQVVESPIEEHSKKPDIVRDLITRLVGELPRVELFCRNPAEGWDVCGNEA
jgi:N6-adenosine-specific RNA methylase IME4